jgi:hypothetical protein
MFQRRPSGTLAGSTTARLARDYRFGEAISTVGYRAHRSCAAARQWESWCSNATGWARRLEAAWQRFAGSGKSYRVEGSFRNPRNGQMGSLTVVLGGAAGNTSSAARTGVSRAEAAFAGAARALVVPASWPEDRVMPSAITGTPGLTGSPPEDRALPSAITGTPGLTGSSLGARPPTEPFAVLQR